MNPCYRAIVMGASAGGVSVIGRILANLPERHTVPVVIVQHLHKSQNGHIIDYYNRLARLSVHAAEDKLEIKPSTVYVAQPDYHLLIEQGGTLSLSMDEKVNFSRPSIDVLFESAGDAFGPEVVGVLLTGANNDGTRGLKYIRSEGGLAVVQNPETAEYREMPDSAVRNHAADHILEVDEISHYLAGLEICGG